MSRLFVNPLKIINIIWTFRLTYTRKCLNNIEIFSIKVFVPNVTDEVLKSKRSLNFLDD